MNISQLRKDKRKALLKGNKMEVATLCNCIGIHLQEMGHYEDALEEHKEEASIFESLDDSVGAGIAYRRMGEVYCEMEEWNKALEFQQKHLTLAINSSNYIEVQRAYATIGRTYWQQAESESNKSLAKKLLQNAEHTYLLALATCKELDGELKARDLGEMRCRVYHNLGLVLDLKGDTSKAMQLVNQGKDLCEKYSLIEDSHRAYAQLARMHLREEKLELALKESNVSLKVAIKMKNKRCEVEAHLLIAQVHLTNGDFYSSKKHFYAAYKKRHPNSDIRESIEKNLKSSLKLCRYSDQLRNEALSVEEKLSIYDKVGDECSLLASYKVALIYYKKMLQLAQEHGKEDKELAPIYSSLAETSRDNKEYKNSLFYYEKELKICLIGQKRGAVTTLICMNEISDSASFPFNAGYYKMAFELAESLNEPKLLTHVIKCHTILKNVPKSTKEEMNNQLKKVCRLYNIDEDAELTEEEHEEKEDIDLNDYIFSDSEDEECAPVAKNSRRVISTKMKLNEHGEAPLHLSAIKGNIKNVMLLLNQKHNVNARDHAGWLPLHEACNHGHYDIAEALLDAGSLINDKGGSDSKGTTPLHDAATNGHLDIVRLLLDRGASPTALNDLGNTPADCVGQDNEETLEVLLKAMEKVGFDTTKHKMQKGHTKTSPNMKRHRSFVDLRQSLRSGYLSDEEEERLEFPSCSTKRNASPTSVTDMYKSVMSEVGSFSKRNESSSASRPVEKIAALLPEDDYVGDNWLIQDLPELNRKRKSEELSPDTSKKPCLIDPVKLRKKKQPKLTSIIKAIATPLELQESLDNTDPYSTNRDSFKRTSSLLTPKNLTENSREPSSQVSPLRLRIEILGVKLLVPVAPSSQSRKIAWLEAEVAMRYFQHSGMKPLKIILTTAEGAILNSDDMINLVLPSDNIELVASVNGWELTSMAERYVEACKSENTRCYSNIKVILANGDSCGSLDFSQSFLRDDKSWQLIIRSIKYQNIQSLDFSTGRFKDQGMLSLIDNLSTFPGLQSLQLRASALTYNSLEPFIKSCEENPATLAKLTNLDISFNNFPQVKMSDLVTLLLIPSLTTLSLKSCQIKLSTDFNASSLRQSNVKILSLDDNNISLNSFQDLLTLLPSVTHLSVGGALGHSSGPHLTACSGLHSILGAGDYSLLENLNLHNCNVTDDDLEIIRSYLYRCSYLKSLNLSYNDDLTLLAVCKLLEEVSRTTRLPLNDLDLSGLSKMFDEQRFSESVNQCLKEKCSSSNPLTRLALPYFDGIKHSIGLWKDFHKEKADIKTFGSEVMFLVK